MTPRGSRSPVHRRHPLRLDESLEDICQPQSAILLISRAKKLLVVILHLVQGPWSFNVTAMKSNFFCITIYLIFLRSSLATSVFGIFDSVPNHVLVLSIIASIMD